MFLFAAEPRVWEAEEGTVHFRPLLSYCSTSDPTALPQSRGETDPQETVGSRARPFQRAGLPLAVRGIGRPIETLGWQFGSYL